MTGRKRWSTDEILDAALTLLRTSHTESFSVRRLAVTLDTDSSSLYRHFRNKTELLRAIADRVLFEALDGHHSDGDWQQRITALGLRLRDAFSDQPQLAAIWGRYGSGGSGSRLIMEEILQALKSSGLPDDLVPVRYHRIVVLLAALITAEGAVATLTPAEHEQSMEQFRVAVFGADAESFPTLFRFARDVRPLAADRRAAFEDILAAQLAAIAAEVPGSPEPPRNRRARVHGARQA
ncbi:TetR family transcriptional regulator [Flexivirga endophytica]|uniref:TetR family transcriptional regulator n=1 Tax=Flexivirga endophytica TaxID=1849103 RepID=A0A916T759_9MICO|nr:TetR/AcrR family transcriptional regulator [Flexivirga endophytica]GGB31788.1 TetR family transcriptional regulator [Flexivirga endophytica]GHB52725.1 TetR family transcriptional regulator [Flexivirga endophytica]